MPNVLNYTEQGGARSVVGGSHDIVSGGELDVESGALLKVASVSVPATVTTSAAAGGSNVCEVTFQVKDGAGNALSGVFNMDIWLSDAATGLGLTGTSASGTVVAKSASGTDLVTLVSKKALRVQTLANGTYILQITDSAKTAFYPCAQVPGLGRTAVGTQLATGNYG